MMVSEKVFKARLAAAERLKAERGQAIENAPATPEQIAQEERQEAMRNLALTLMVDKGNDTLSKMFVWWSIDDQTKNDIITKAEPVLAKYDISGPNWLEKYAEEFELGMCLAGVGYGLYENYKKEQRAAQSKDVTPQGGSHGDKS